MFGGIALLGLCFCASSLDQHQIFGNFYCLSEGLPRVHSSNWEESLPAIELAEKVQHFWQRICCRSCDRLWCPWYICFNFWAWSFMASPFHSILSCGLWMFKAVSGSLQFCLICGIRTATSMPCYFFVNQHFFGASLRHLLIATLLPIMYIGLLSHYIKYFLAGFCPGIQNNCSLFTGVTLLTDDA